MLYSRLQYDLNFWSTWMLRQFSSSKTAVNRLIGLNSVKGDLSRRHHWRSPATERGECTSCCLRGGVAASRSLTKPALPSGNIFVVVDEGLSRVLKRSCVTSLLRNCSAVDSVRRRLQETCCVFDVVQLEPSSVATKAHVTAAAAAAATACLYHYVTSDRSAKYCEQRVCLSVCLSAPISQRPHAKTHEIFRTVLVKRDRGSVFF